MNTLEGLRDLLKTEGSAAKAQDTADSQSIIKNIPVGRIAVVTDGFACNVRISKEVTAFWTVEKSEVRLVAVDLTKREGFHLQSGLTLGEQAIGFSKTSAAISNVSDAPSTNDVLLTLPVIVLKADAEFSRPFIRIQGDVCIHHFTGTLKPSTFDRVLAMYRAIGSDMKAIGRLLSNARGAPANPNSQLEHEKSAQKHQQRFIINLAYEVKGVHLSLKASDIVSTLLIQSGRVYGNFSRDTDITGETWSAHLDSLELSLGHAQEPPKDRTSQRSRAIQSAHLLCSFAIEQKPRLENTSSEGKRPTAIIDTTIQRVHAVMHVSALEEMYSLLNSWSRDLKILAERRKQEWEEIKEGTKELIRADVKTGEAEAVGWMESAILTVVISSFAVAVPLHAESVLDKRRQSSLPAALLFTIRRLDVVNRKGESGRTGMQDLYLQYVDSFDSHDDRHYDGQFHLSNNRMHLPEAQLQFMLEHSSDIRSLQLSSIFKGFELRLDRHVGRYMAKTYVVYSRGKAQIEQLYRAYSVDIPEAQNPETPKAASVNPQGKDTRPPGRLLALQCSAEFVSGRVLLIKGTESYTSRRSTYASTADIQEQLKAGTLAESISLPGVSLWVDSMEGTELSPGTCRISTIIQRSENILKPSILQFVESATEPGRNMTAIPVASIQTGPSDSLPVIREREESPNQRRASIQEADSSLGHQAISPLAGLTAKTRLIISLRIDKSRLALSCEPDNQVVADLAWDSGGFNLQCQPRAETIAATMQISSVSFHLYREIYQMRHTFVSGALAGLTGTFVLRDGQPLPAVEAMIYTKVSADLNIKLLRQWFAFNSVWIARLSPMTRTTAADASGSVSLPARPPCEPDQQRSPLIHRTGRLGKIGRHVIICVRLHQVSLRANLDVSKVDIEIPVIDGRLAANDTIQRLLVDLGSLKMIGTRTVSGRVINDGIRFVAERKKILEDTSYVTVMELRIDAKDTLAELACIEQHVLGLHIYPTVVELHDDCLMGLEKGACTMRKMGLAFKINLGQVDMMFAMLSLNALLDEFHSFLRRIDDEKTEAEHGSAAYRHHLANKPKNAIAAVAETMQKSRLTEMPAGATDLHIEQRLVLVTQRANLAIQATNEEKIYVVRLTPVHAKYRKTGHDRHLEAEVESVRLSRDRPKDITMLKDMKSVGEWLHNKTGVTREELVSLPFITILMDSVENEVARILDYDFDINYHNQKIKIALTMQAIRDAQEAYSIAKQIRAGKMDRDATAENMMGEAGAARSNDLILRPRKVNLRPPPADYLGSTTDEMLRLLKYDQAFLKAPHASHVVQTKLDMIMDLLLTIYNKLECNLP
ncbi:hypothetical protein QFC19_003742 [Naganishia cerealis]|uniref:Uncharacterized protein n=1 Tax=Naganishia cerealis TaxID=610337 RepID=A0ACC2W014_9TREE|nr:hypothetical protein QFC19_003742 [Naganishia cerealis]